MSQSWKPLPYMKQGVEWLLANSCAGLIFKPGMKKTSITLKALTILKKMGVMKKALVLAPVRVASITWPGEIEKWKEFNDFRYVFLHGEEKDFDTLARDDYDIALINYEGLAWLFEQYRTKSKTPGKLGKLRYRYKEFLGAGFDTLVVDESSKFRNSRTNRFKALKGSLESFVRRWVLTGTPNPKSYMDLFSQVFIVDMGRSLSPYITHFRARYFTPLDRNGWKWALNKGSEELIQKAISPYFLSLSEEDVGLNIPKEISTTIRVELPKEARRIYDEMEELLITEIGKAKKEIVVAANLGVAYGKCAQIANGGLYHQRTAGLREKRRWTDVHWEKAKVTVARWKESKTPAMIVYDFEHDLVRLTKLLGADFPRIGAGVNVKESLRLVDAWNAGKLKGMLVHAKAVSHGLNMQFGPGNRIIWHSITDDFEDYDQLIRRLRRDGARYKEVYVDHIVASHTVDEAKMRRLRSKDKSQTGLLKALQEYAKRRTK